MILLLSPSKQMNLSGNTANSYNPTTPVFINEACTIMRSLADYTSSELAEILHTNPKLAHQAFCFAKEFSLPMSSAFIAKDLYRGVAYKEIKFNDFSELQFTKANNSLRIASAVYGILKPGDLIKPYRLDFYNEITINENFVKLQNYWKQKLTAQIISEVKSGDGILVNVASTETTNAFDLKLLKSNIKYINISFVIEDIQKVKSVPAVIAKKARGTFVNDFITKDYTDISQLKNFNRLNMNYCEHLSDASNIVFRYEK